MKLIVLPTRNSAFDRYTAARLRLPTTVHMPACLRDFLPMAISRMDPEALANSFNVNRQNVVRESHHQHELYRCALASLCSITPMAAQIPLHLPYAKWSQVRQ